jgi:HSP20 family molecular chaperone IbpA
MNTTDTPSGTGGAEKRPRPPRARVSVERPAGQVTETDVAQYWPTDIAVTPLERLIVFARDIVHGHWNTVADLADLVYPSYLGVALRHGPTTAPESTQTSQAAYSQSRREIATTRTSLINDAIAQHDRIRDALLSLAPFGGWSGPSTTRDLRPEALQARFRESPSTVEETADAYIVEFAVPGWTARELTVRATGRSLQIRGQTDNGPVRTRVATRVEGQGTLVYEAAWDPPEEIDVDHVTATVELGVLRVTLPKLEPTASRVVPVD